MLTEIENYFVTCQQLRDEDGFDLLISLTAVDRKDFLEVVVHLARSTDMSREIVKTVVSGEGPMVVPSITPIWPGADWHERECYDLFGIKFQGHPNLKRILLKEDFDGYPLRKDFQPVEITSQR